MARRGYFPGGTRGWMAGVISILALTGCSGLFGELGEFEGGPDDDDESGELTVEIISGPPEWSNEQDAELEFECTWEEGCQFYCDLNEAGEELCTSPVVYADLEDGHYRFEVWAVTDEGLESEAAWWEWEVDTVSPQVVDLEGPPEITNETEALLRFSCSKDDCSYECSLNGSLPESCEPDVLYEDLSDGEYEFQVRATDGLGQVGPTAVHEWMVDTVPPQILDLTGPESLTNETTATFDFGCSKEECLFHCSLNEGEWASCEPGETYEELEEGAHLFVVQASDPLGNQGEESIWEWAIDVTPPELVIDDGPEGEIFEDEVNFEFYCAEGELCDFECDLYFVSLSGEDESSGWQTCNSPFTEQGLEDGDYLLTIRAVDQAGNESIREVNWSVRTDRWTMISAGVNHSCGIRHDATLWCWGSNSAGQLGVGDTESRFAPTQVGSEEDWRGVATGHSHSCGVREDLSLWCWGAYTHGQLGIGNVSSPQLEPQQVGESQDWETVGVGWHHSCGITTGGALWCWGRNGTGQLGLGHEDTEFEPANITGGSWAAVAGGADHTCAITIGGALWCWGDNERGQLGQGDNQSSSSPQPVGFEEDWEAIVAGREFSCGIRAGGLLYCWGSNTSGRLGVGGGSHRDEPTQVGFYSDWVDVSTGSSHGCGVRDNGTLWCWGEGRAGKTGQGTEDTVTSPVQSGDDEDWYMVAAGADHSIGLTDSYRLWGWGNNTLGQTGLDDGTTEVLVPTEVEED